MVFKSITSPTFHQISSTFLFIFATMIHIYGIPSCDTVQKAIKWLNTKEIRYQFHNFKEEGVTKETLTLWLRHFPTDKLINTKSATWRGLTDDEKASISSKPKAISIMMKNSPVIKRPVWDFGDGVFFLGWDEGALQLMI
jgi:arsenate reductase (glutaredoxin)